MATHNAYRFADPRREDAAKMQLFSMFPETEFVKKSQEEGNKWGLYYWPQPADENEMAFEYQRRLNPSTYGIKLEGVYRLFHKKDNKEYLYWFAQRFCRSPPPAETLPGKEHNVSNYYGMHFRPVVQVEGYDYYQKPVNPKLISIELVYEQEWSQEAYKKLINSKDVKFKGHKMYVGLASPNANRLGAIQSYTIKSEEDFLKESWKDLWEFGASRFDSMEEFKRTKELAAQEHKSITQSQINKNIPPTT